MQIVRRHRAAGAQSGESWRDYCIAVTAILVLSLAVIVQERAFAETVSNKDLPSPVHDMRDLILTAVKAGNADELKSALEWNELPPDLGNIKGADLIAEIKKASVDGEGREILAALGEILELPPAALPLGADIENNLIYVWPYLAEKPLDQLSPPEVVDLYRLVPPDVAKTMIEKKKWAWWRLAISADGTWQSFTRQKH